MKESRRELQKLAQGVGIFALGAAIGSVTALLCAPASGQATRRRIAQKFRTLKRQTTRQFGQRIRQAQAWVVEHVHNGNGKRTHQTLHHA